MKEIITYDDFVIYTKDNKYYVIEFEGDYEGAELELVHTVKYEAFSEIEPLDCFEGEYDFSGEFDDPTLEHGIYMFLYGFFKLKEKA